MAHSTQEFSGRYVTLDDLDIVATLGVAYLVLNDRQDDGWVQNLVKEWRDRIEMAGPGCIDLALGEIAKTKEDRDKLLELMRTIREKALSFGDLIPLESISYARDIAFGKLNDYPSHLVSKVTSDIEEILR